NVNPAYKILRKENGNNPVPVALQKIDLYTMGLAKQLLYYDNYISYRSSQTVYYLNRYQKAITNKYLRKQLEEKAESATKTFEAYNVIQKINDYKIDESLKTRLLKIFEKEKNNYLFVDFWGSWCGPCMLEMPVYPKFIGQFNKDTLHFLFLSYEMTEEQVIQIKNKYGIAGDFILLNNNEMKILNNVLGFESYPHHFVIDPESFVVNNNISGIESGDEPNKEVIKKVQDILAKGK
ncbi:MAG TPA: TlpA disulfide reductase family protein, partial [Puia sp.]|nr:TlpA disulfide reductase family protein [Puia sp.]